MGVPTAIDSARGNRLACADDFRPEAAGLREAAAASERLQVDRAVKVELNALLPSRDHQRVGAEGRD